MDGVVLVLVGHVIRGGRSGVDSTELDVVVLHHDTGDKTSDTSESVNSHTGGHGHGGSVGGGTEGGSGEGGRSVGGSAGDERKGSDELPVEQLERISVSAMCVL